MDYRNDADGLMRALAAHVGDPAIMLDGEGYCLAELNGIPFAFSYDGERRCLFIQSSGGSLVRAEDQEAVLLAVLQANYLWGDTAGGVIGLDGQSGELGLAYRLDFPLAATGEDFPEDLLCELLPQLAGVTWWIHDLVSPAGAEQA